jgi:hypothetical protein
LLGRLRVVCGTLPLKLNPWRQEESKAEEPTADGSKGSDDASADKGGPNAGGGSGSQEPSDSEKQEKPENKENEL